MGPFAVSISTVNFAFFLDMRNKMVTVFFNLILSRTGLVYSQDMTGHKNIWDSNFPEKPERITDPYRRCSELGLVDRCIQMKVH